MKVNSQEFSELDIGGRETCKQNFENSDIFWRESFYIKIIEFYQELQNFCRRLSMLWDKLHEKFFFIYAALFFRVLGFRLNISQYIHFLLKVTHVHSTAGLEQDIPRLQLACDLSRFLFQQSLSNSRLLLTFRHGPKSSRSHSVYKSKV